MSGIKCFMLEPTDRQQLYLRRYASDSKAREVPGSKCPGPMGYHDALVKIEQSAETWDAEKQHWVDDGRTSEDFKDDPRWPTHCVCGYEFQASDERQLFSQHLYRRLDTGEETTLRDAPVGAIWEATWYSGIPAWHGPDGKALICRLPGGHDWHIDGRASNCTMPNDDVHKCWVRHGTPPNLTVDKNGNTCGAGGGSIALTNWHGFLRNGELVT